MKKILPGGVTRGYLLDIEIHSSSDDEEYFLCFDSTGDMFVQIYYSPNKPFQSGYWGTKIYPSEFDKHKVEDKTLRQLVVAKLGEILPPGAETKWGS